MILARRLLSGLSGAFAALASLALLVLMAATVADVVNRGLTDSSIAGAVEVAPLVLLAAVVLGFGHGELTYTHVRSSLVTGRMAERTRAGVRAVASAFLVAMLVWITDLSFDRAVDAYNLDDTTAGFESIPTWPARAFVPVGFGLWAAVLALRLVDDVRTVLGRARVEDEPESVAAGLEGLGAEQEQRP